MNKLDFITIQPKKGYYYLDAQRLDIYLNKGYEIPHVFSWTYMPYKMYWVIMMGDYPIIIPEKVFKNLYEISLKAK